LRWFNKYVESPQNTISNIRGHEPDVRFYFGLGMNLKPKTILELARDAGRISLSLAEQRARSGFSVVGLDNEVSMLKEARCKARRFPKDTRRSIRLVRGDMRKWRWPEHLHLVLVRCASITHLLELSDQLRVWRHAFENLRPSGSFAVDTTMPNFLAYADSFANKPRSDC